MSEQRFPCSLWGRTWWGKLSSCSPRWSTDPAGAKAGAGGCPEDPVTLWEVPAGAGYWQNLWPHREPTWSSLVLKDCPPGRDLHWSLWRAAAGVKDSCWRSLLWEGLHVGAGEECEEWGKRSTETTYGKLTTAPIPCSPALLWGPEGREMGNEAESRKKGGIEGALRFNLICWYPEKLFLITWIFSVINWINFPKSSLFCLRW